MSAWLETPFEPFHFRRLHDEGRIAEMRTLRAKGLRIAEIAERYGVSRSGVSNILKEKVYKHVPRADTPAQKVGDLKWVFPVSKIGGGVPWIERGQYEDIKAAGKAVGIEGLRISDLRYLYRHSVRPALVMLKPSEASPISKVSPVLLGGRNDPPMVLGTYLKERLTDAERFIVIALNEAFPGGLTWVQLDVESGQPASRTVINRLKEKDPIWGRVIQTPGKKGGICRFVTPTET
jgi:hypothetical protein